MANEKPKHKPQKKRTLEEVLKSLQDLVRNDLVSTRPVRQTWRESGREEKDPNAANEPDTFHKALFKLDQIINEKIIEPVERAKETPPEPLLPDEEVEIEWEIDEPLVQKAVDDQQTEIATEDLAALDRAAASLETIEIKPLEAPSDSPPAAGDTVARSEPQPQEPPIEPVPETIEEVKTAPVEPIETAQTESIEIEVVAPPESPAVEPTDLAPAPESADVAEPDPQHTFDFSAPAKVEPAKPPTPSVKAPPTSELSIVDDTPTPATELPTVDKVPETPTANALTDSPRSQPSAELAIVDLSEDVAAASDKPKEPPEQPVIPTVESENTGKNDAYMVEFTVESIAPKPAIPMTPDAGADSAVTTQSDTPTKDDAHQPPKDSAVKEQTPPPDSEKTSGKPPEQERETPVPPEPEKPVSGPEEIPVLKDVADISAPAAPPLPEATHARDIAIRVIAKLNIERRKAGEKPLDIKTIERLQQYLADALSKRALKPK